MIRILGNHRPLSNPSLTESFSFSLLSLSLSLSLVSLAAVNLFLIHVSPFLPSCDWPPSLARKQLTTKTFNRNGKIYYTIIMPILLVGNHRLSPRPQTLSKTSCGVMYRLSSMWNHVCVSVHAGVCACELAMRVRVCIWTHSIYTTQPGNDAEVSRS